MSENPRNAKLEGVVLVVDDEDMVRRVVRDLLERLGLEVLEARDGVEALEVFVRHRQDIRCVLLDFRMPRMDGIETLTELRKIDSAVPVLFASGYVGKLFDSLDALLPVGFICKPFDLQALRAALEQALAPRQPDSQNDRAQPDSLSLSAED